MLPKFIQPFLWFSDLKSVDSEKDKDRVILNLLNLGTKKSTDWLFENYPRAVIRRVVMNRGGLGELSPKSLNYWVHILKIDKRKLKRTRLPKVSGV